jgi:hypothetical protein
LRCCNHTSSGNNPADAPRSCGGPRACAGGGGEGGGRCRGCCRATLPIFRAFLET